MSFMKHLLLIVLSISFYSSSQHTTQSESIVFLVDTYLKRPGDSIFGVQSSTIGIGSFNGSNSNIGMSSGIIMTTGTISGPNGPVGPNNVGGAGIDNGVSGHSGFSNIAGGQSYNVARIQYTIIPAYKSLSFEYVFGSEEYLEYLGISPTDAMAR